MNQRLTKGEIWPSWWNGSRWAWHHVWPFAAFWFLFSRPILFGWILKAESPLVAVGRTIYAAGMIASIAVVVNVTLNTIQPRLKRELDGHNLQLSLLAHGSVRSALATWFVTDLLTLLLRLIRYFPLFAIAAVAGGITWGNAVSFALFAAVTATAVLAAIYATTVTDPYRYVVDVAVTLLVGWWAYRNFDFSILTFGPSYDLLPYHLAVLAAVTVCALLWAAAVLEIRVRWHGGWSVARRRFHGPVLLRRWPAVALLVRGLRGRLGILGGIPAIVLVSAVCVGIGLIPALGGFFLLIGISIVVPQFVIALHRGGVWEDVYLASDSTRVWQLLPSSDARDWTRAVCGACCVATLPVLPGLVTHAVLGRFALDGGWSAMDVARQVAMESRGAYSAATVALGVGLAAAFCITALALAFVVSTLEGFVHLAVKRSGSWAGATSAPSTIIMITPFVASMALIAIVQQIGSPFAKLIWITSGYLVVGMFATIVMVWSYHNLRHLMEHARELTTADYEHAIGDMLRRNKRAR